MKKRMIVVLLLSLCVYLASAQRVIDDPSYTFRSTGLARIARIELTDKATTVKYVSEFLPGWWVQFNRKDLYIEDPQSGQRYPVVEARGIKWGEKKPTPKCGADTFYFTFPPLPQEIKTIHLIDGTTGIYGIRLEEESGGEAAFPGQFAGNWYDGNGVWKYGIYEDFVIYDHKFWDYQKVRAGKKELTLQLRHGEKQIVLYVSQLKDGNCQIGTNRRHRPVYTPRSAAKYPVSPDTTIAGEFFQPQSKTVIRGYIRGYDPRSGFTTGLIYHCNPVTEEDYPTVATVHPDGRFEAELTVDFPMLNTLNFGRNSLTFYATPGDTLTMYVEWEDFMLAYRYRNRIFHNYPHLDYMGKQAVTNRNLVFATEKLFAERQPSVRQLVTKITPNAYLQQQTRRYDEGMDSLQSLAARYRFTPEARRLLQCKIYTDVALKLFDFEMQRRYAKPDSNNRVLNTPIDSAYYRFLHYADLNDNYLLPAYQSRFFINRLEYCPLVRKAARIASAEADSLKAQGKPITFLQEQLREWQEKERIFREELGLPLNMMHDIIRLHDAKFVLRKATPAHIDTLRPALRITHPYVQAQAEKYIEASRQPRKPYVLPDTKAAAIFRKIVDPHKGKIVFVDFWATTCAPCCAGIKAMKPVREEYKDKDVAFVFITDEKASPLAAYEKFMKDVEGYKHRIPQSDYNYLRELFRFNGIPRYVILGRNGEVLNDNYRGVLRTDLEQLLAAPSPALP